jgi:F0F1-type ATP synthase alpha subunit
VLQVVDADRGPSTKREFLSFEVPAGDDLYGQVVDFLGRPQGSKQQIGTDASIPLYNISPTMEMRQQIHEPLLTGVKVKHGASGHLCLMIQLESPFHCPLEPMVVEGRV